MTVSRDRADPASALVPVGVFEPAGIAEVVAGAQGRFAGAALFLDVTGFTTLSERLGRAGSAGTEELVQILNGFFEPAIELVRDAGGEVVAFGGDAITAVWPGDGSLEHAASCARQLADLAGGRGQLRTSIGDFGFAVRIGVAGGTVDVTIGGRADRVVVLLHGDAIDRAVGCEAEADPGDVVARDPDGALFPASVQALGAVATSPVGGRPAPEPDRFAHPVTVERLRRGDVTLIDGHRRVTTVFAQIPALDQLTMSDAIGVVVDVAKDFGGEVIQVTGGDKGTVALLTFGAPTSCPDDACRAVAAGMRLIRDLAGASIGISTGTVFAGQVGGAPRSVYTVIGDSVNLAARLMQRAEPGSALVDEPTASAASAVFTFDGWRTVDVKGKDEGVRVGRPADQRGRVWPTNRLATDGPMIGRSDQLALAERALETTETGVRRVVIRGSAGIGKSRFARALADRATARGWFVVAGGFAGFGDVAPYAAWQPVLRSILAAHGGVELALERLLPDHADLIPLLGPLLGLALAESVRSSAIGGELRSELAEELAVRVIEAAAEQRPIVIELEDWHWADGASARLLDVLITHPGPMSVVVVITHRVPLEGAPLTPHGRDIVIELAELDDDVTRDVAASVLARTGQPVDEARIARIVELGAGNPLMIETLVDVGEEAVLTTGLAPLLQARLDGLPDSDLRVLLWASAFGRPVVADELGTAMAEGQEGSTDIGERLERLVSGGLLAAVQPTDEAPLDFRHASVREAAHERLSHGSRRRVHHSVGRTMEANDGQPVEIARQFAQTDDADRQLHWFPLAGAQARAAWAVDDAISWMDRARGLGERSDEVRVSLSEMLMVRGELDRVAELVAEPCADPSFDRRRLILSGERAMITGANDAAVQTLTQALHLASTSGSPGEACAAAEVLSRALLESGRFDDAEQVALASIEAVDPDDHDTLARAIGAYGTVQVERYDLAGAMTSLRRAVAEAERGQDRVRLVHLKSDLAAVCGMSGDVTSSLEAMFSAREIAEGIGYRRHLALSVSNEAETRLSLGDGPAVTTLSLRGLRAAADLGDIGLACDNLLRLSANDDISIADRRSILAASIRLEQALGRPHVLIESRTVSIEIAALEPGGAPHAEAASVLADARELGRPDLELRVLSAMGAQADLAALEDLGSRLDEPGDRFVLDMQLRRITNEHAEDDDVRARGLALFRRAPFAVYRRCLAALGVQDPPTDVVVPPMATSADDPVYSLSSVLNIIDSLHGGRPVL